MIVQFCIVICGTMLASRKHVCKSQGMLIIIAYDKPGKICLNTSHVMTSKLFLLNACLFYGKGNIRNHASRVHPVKLLTRYSNTRFLVPRTYLFSL